VGEIFNKKLEKKDAPDTDKRCPKKGGRSRKT
ncbi:uncharacterized protein METZ01_LOCUS293130, partial [marine metagenome]